jgi:hypothetical protein
VSRTVKKRDRRDTRYSDGSNKRSLKDRDQRRSLKKKIHNVDFNDPNTVDEVDDMIDGYEE